MDPSALSPDFGLMFILCLTAGWLLGILTGVVPGIHVNTISAILVSASPFLKEAGISVVPVCLIILSCAISNTFHNIIPAVFLGAPGEETAFAAMPGHRLLMSGKGSEAVRLSVAGSCGAVLLSPFLMAPLALFLYLIHPLLYRHLGAVLLVISLLIVLTEPTARQKVYASFVFLIAGLFGLYSFRAAGILFPETSVLLPLLSGLFGVPHLLISLFTETTPLPMKAETTAAPLPLVLKSLFHGTFFGAVVSWIPGVSSSVGAIFSGFFIENDDEPDRPDSRNDGDAVLKKTCVPSVPMPDVLRQEEKDERRAKEYIVAVSSINTANALFGLLAYFIIHKSRNGAVIAMDELLQADSIFVKNMAMADALLFFLYLYAAMVLCSFLSCFSTICLGRLTASFLNRINYKKLSSAVLIFLAAVVFGLSGLPGIFILSAATLMGLLPVFMHLRKAPLMGVILLPVTLYFLS